MLPDPSPETLAWLGDALLQCTLLVAAALVSNRLLSRRAAAARHALLLAAALAIPALFALPFLLPSWQVPLPAIALHAGDLAATSSIEVAASPPVEQATQSTATPAPREFPLMPLLLIAWFTGSLACWLRLGAGIVTLGLKRSSSPVDPLLRRLVATAAKNAGLRRAPKVLLCARQSMPMTWWLPGGHRLALPLTALGWPAEKLDRVLRHEMAHIRRRDCLGSWAADACISLLWFHPLAWRLRFAIQSTREAACDDVVLEDVGAEARDAYAKTLLEIVGAHSRSARCPGLALAMARADRGIRNRLDSILDPGRSRRPLSRRSRILIWPAWAAGTAALATMSACHSTAPPNPVPPSPGESAKVTKPTSHVAIEIHMVELDDPAPLEALFPLPEPDASPPSPAGRFTGTLPNTRTREIIAQLVRKGGKVTPIPTIITRYGESGKASKVREIIYPTQYDPPEIPEQFMKDGEPPEKLPNTFPVTPANPTAFEMREAGFQCEVTPSRGDGGSVVLGIELDHTRYLGNIDYGSPIYGTAKGLFGKPVEVVLTENRIEQPVFRTDRLKGELRVPAGDTVAIVGFAQPPVEGSPPRDPRGHTGVDTPKSTLYLFTPRAVE